MQSTIVYYTHNFLFPKLLKTTVENAILHAKEWNCQLMIISQFPILKEYINVRDEFNGSEDDNLPVNLKKFCIKDLNIEKQSFCINYVTGKMPYNGRSILQKLIFAVEHCYTPNMILFEHDCFYPDSYIGVVNYKLENYDLTYCMGNYDMLNRKGFYRCEPHAFLSSFSAKKECFHKVFLHKKTIYGDGKVSLLEPVVPYDLIIREIKWKNEKSSNPVKKIIRPRTYRDMNPILMGNSRQHAGNEMVIENSICIDVALGNNTTILELEHGLNTSNSLSLMRYVYDNSYLDDEYTIDSKIHPYWGDSQTFTNMFEDIEETELTRKMHAMGAHECNL